MQQYYPSGTIKALLQTKYVSPVTKKVLEERMSKEDATPLFFDPPAFETLSIVCDLLMAQDAQKKIFNIAIFIDERLKNITCDGWRYDCMPPDEQMYLKGLTGMDETAMLLYQLPFSRLSTDQQVNILNSIQRGTTAGSIWQEMSSKLFFEELLAETTEIFYSHPLVQEEIGYVGMADAIGWTRIGINEKEAIEPDASTNETVKL